MEEIWKDIEGYEGYYQISNTGKVKSIARTVIKLSGIRFSVKEKLVAININSAGYYCATLCYCNHTYPRSLHTLIAKAFIDNPNNLPLVCHKNDIKLDIRLENLYWGNKTTNAIDSINNGHSGVGENHPNNKLSIEEVKQIKLLIRDGLGNKEIAKRFAISPSNVGNIKYGKIWKVITI